MFKKNENVVYPAHGVCVVTDIVKRSVGNKEKQFYVLKVLNNEITIMMPTDNKDCGLRAIVKKQEAKKVLEYIKTYKPKTQGAVWAIRYREHMEKLRTGSIYEIAEVYKTLSTSNKDSLSFGERKVLDVAKDLLLIEIALALDMNPGETDTLFQLYAS